MSAMALIVSPVKPSVGFISVFGGPEGPDVGPLLIVFVLFNALLLCGSYLPFRCLSPGFVARFEWLWSFLCGSTEQCTEWFPAVNRELVAYQRDKARAMPASFRQ